MSKGSPIVTFRMPPDLGVELESYLTKRLLTKGVSHITRSDFITQAIQFKLAHLKRSTTKRRKKTRADLPAEPSV